jgi:hypothetical protein
MTRHGTLAERIEPTDRGVGRPDVLLDHLVVDLLSASTTRTLRAYGLVWDAYSFMFSP